MAALALVWGALILSAGGPAAADMGLPTSASASVSDSPVPYGTSVTYTVAVDSGAGDLASGPVTFQTGTTSLCSTTLVSGSGTASCAASNAPGGADQIVAVYFGGGGFDASSATTTLVVDVAAPPPPPGATASMGDTGLSQTGVVTAQVGNLSVQANGPGAVTAAAYGANPTASQPVGATGVFYDVATGTGSSFASMTIAVCGYGAGSSLQWYDEAIGSWLEFSLQQKQVACLFAAVTADSSPSLAQLNGTPIAVSWLASPSSPPGYWLVARDGGIFSFDRPYFGSTGNIGLNQPIVGMAPTHDDGGYWLVAGDGGIFSFGDAVFEGSLPSEGIATSGVVGIVSDAATNGYAVIRRDGTVWDFDTPQFGDLPIFGIHVDDIVGGAVTPDGKGLYLVGADGEVYALEGDAVFQGDAAGTRLNAPIVGMAVDPATGGYWLVGADGGVFSFGAPFFGSTGNLRLNQPIVGMSASGDGGGYWFTAADGGVFSFGDAPFEGSMGTTRLNQPVVGLSAA